MTDNRPIGVFDSGLGGLSVLHRLQKTLPHEHVVYFGDSRHNPYGMKSPDQILARCIEICDFLLSLDVKAIVIACNTATSVAVKELRKRYPVPIIGMEPALKPAVDRKPFQKVAVWATRTTLAEEKFDNLMKRYQGGHQIRTLPAGKLVELVESDRIESEEAREVLQNYLQVSDWENLDSLVLGCTHFLFFQPQIEALSGNRFQIVEGHGGTIMQLIRILSGLDQLGDNDGSLTVFNSDPEKLELSVRLLQYLEDQWNKREISQ